MKLQKSSRTSSSAVVPVRMGAAQLYQAQVVGAANEVTGVPAAVEVSTEVMHTLWSLGTRLSEFRLHGFLLAHRAKLSKNTIQVADVQWHSSEKPFFGGEFSIPLRYCTKLELPVKHQTFLDTASEFFTASYAGHKDLAQPQDLLLMECYMTTEDNISLHFLRIWPAVTLVLTPISPLRIISTDLAVRLIKEKREETKVRTGFLTMDKSKRLMLLRSSDPQSSEIPLVGIWISGLHKAKHESPQNLIWAAAAHYLLQWNLTRLSNDPQRGMFLLLVISSPTSFYEVSKSDSVTWQLSKSTLLLTGTEPGNMIVPLRFPEVVSARQSVSSSGSDGHNSSNSVHTSTDSSKPQSSVEELVRETTTVLMSLERQLQDLKSKVGVGVTGEQRVSSSPRSARGVRQETRAATLRESISTLETGAVTDRGLRHYPSFSLSYKGNAPRYSLPVSRRSPPRDEPPVPQIEYRSESDTSEDEDRRY